MAAVDREGNKGSALDSPANGAEAVTKHDVNELMYVSRGLWVGTGGHVVGLMADGSIGTFLNVQNGTLLPFRFKRINSTGTTATDMTSVY